VLGEEHPSSLMSMNNLTLIYYKQGWCKDTGELQVLVVEVSKQVLGKEHPLSLMSITPLC